MISMFQFLIGQIRYKDFSALKTLGMIWFPSLGGKKTFHWVSQYLWQEIWVYTNITIILGTSTPVTTVN